MGRDHVKSIKAFSDPKYTYYRLSKPFGLLKKGTIFYHDTDDHVFGSPAEGCLKNCWTPVGNCENNICGGTVILHADFARTDWFEKVEMTAEALMNFLPVGHYKLDVNADGSWDIHKYGAEE